MMTLNCRYGRANAAAIVSAVKERDVAVLALQELTDDLVAALTRPACPTCCRTAS